MKISKLTKLFGLSAALALIGIGNASAALTPSDGTKVSFTGPNGITLTGVLYRPDNYTQSTNWPAVVMMHGCSGMWSSSKVDSANSDGSPNLQRHIESWGRFLSDRGYYALAVDSFAGHGDAQNQCGGTNATDPYTERPGDARSAHAYLANTGRVNSARIGLLGWSQGAEAAMVEAAETELTSNTTRTNHLFAATAVFYPGCGANMQFGGVSSSYWRPHADFRMSMGTSDSFKADCNTRVTRARNVYGSIANSGHEAGIFIYGNSAHSFDYDGRSGYADTWFPSTSDAVACSFGSATVWCDMVEADWGAVFFLDGRLM